VNLLIAFLIFFFIFLGREETTDTVGAISAGTPAAQALEQGDRIVAVDGVRGDVEALREQIASHECAGEAEDGCVADSAATLVVIRDGRRVEITARPEYDAQAERMLLGFQYGTQPANLSVREAAGESVDFMWFVTSQTISTIAQIFDADKREEISSVVGGYETTRQAIDFDGRTALLLLGVISLSLAVINLFPFLPLDGGHIFWSLVEKVRGKPVPFSVMERAGVVGFALVLMLFFVGLTNDIGRLTGEGFGPR
jgi:regulator of sigma E protease